MSAIEIVFSRGTGINHRPVPEGGDPVGHYRGVDLARARLVERSNFALCLGLQEVRAFEGNEGVQGIVDVVNALAPAAGDRASQDDIRKLLAALTTGGHARNGTEILELLELIDTPGLSGRQKCRLLLILASGPGCVEPHQLAPFIADWTGVPPRITVLQFGEMCIALAADPTVTTARLVETLTELKQGNRPEVGYRIYRRLCTAENALPAAAFCELVIQLRHPPGHLGELSTEQIDDLTTRLLEAPADNTTPVRLRAMADAWIGAAPLQTHPLGFYWITRKMREAGTSPAGIHAFATERQGNYDALPVRATWLFHLCTEQPLATVASIQRAAVIVGGYARISNTVSLMAAHKYPAAYAGELLALARTLTLARIDAFLRAASPLAGLATDGGWANVFCIPLRNLVASGRAPHGAHVPFPATMVDGAAMETTNSTRNSFVLHSRALDHACNAHLFRHCDFDERDGRATPYLTFWPGGRDAAYVRAQFRLVPDTFLDGLVNQRAGGVYRSAVWNGELDVGIQRFPQPPVQPGQRYIWHVTHFMPSPNADANYSIRKAALRALSELFN